MFNGAFFLVTIYLQTTPGYSPLAAGAATLPITLLMIALSPPVGRWAATVGARGPMVAGQMLAAGVAGTGRYPHPRRRCSTCPPSPFTAIPDKASPSAASATTSSSR